MEETKQSDALKTDDLVKGVKWEGNTFVNVRLGELQSTEYLRQGDYSGNTWSSESGSKREVETERS